MENPTQRRGNARVTFIGHGHGYFVTSYQARQGVMGHVALAGPFTSAEQAQSCADKLNADAESGEE
jgi:hypothetical protein